MVQLPDLSKGEMVHNRSINIHSTHPHTHIGVVGFHRDVVENNFVGQILTLKDTKQHILYSLWDLSICQKKIMLSNLMVMMMTRMMVMTNMTMMTTQGVGVVAPKWPFVLPQTPPQVSQ